VPGTHYKVWAKGPRTGIGVTDSLHIGIAGVAKAASPGLPFSVANELICGHLARAILLPVPPGFIIEDGGIPHHVSLNFNLAGHNLPPADAAAVVANHSRLATGILVA
jgi:hypothetical protein